MAAAAFEQPPPISAIDAIHRPDMRPAPLSLVASPPPHSSGLPATGLDSPYRTNSGLNALMLGLTSPTGAVYSPPPASMHMHGGQLSQSLVSPVAFPATSGLPIPIKSTNTVRPVPNKAVAGGNALGFGLTFPLQAVNAGEAPVSGQSTVSVPSGGLLSSWSMPTGAAAGAASPSTSLCENELQQYLTLSASGTTFGPLIGRGAASTPPPPVSPPSAASYMPSTYGGVISPTNAPSDRQGARAPVPCTPPRAGMPMSPLSGLQTCVTPRSIPGSPAVVPRGGGSTTAASAQTLSPMPSPAGMQRFRTPTNGGEAKLLWG